MVRHIVSNHPLTTLTLETAFIHYFGYVSNSSDYIRKALLTQADPKLLRLRKRESAISHGTTIPEAETSMSSGVLLIGRRGLNCRCTLKTERAGWIGYIDTRSTPWSQTPSAAKRLENSFPLVGGEYRRNNLTFNTRPLSSDTRILCSV